MNISDNTQYMKYTGKNQRVIYNIVYVICNIFKHRKNINAKFQQEMDA